MSQVTIKLYKVDYFIFSNHICCHISRHWFHLGTFTIPFLLLIWYSLTIPVLSSAVLRKHASQFHVDHQILKAIINSK